MAKKNRYFEDDGHYKQQAPPNLEIEVEEPVDLYTADATVLPGIVAVVTEFRGEMQKVLNGVSEYYKGSIHFPKGVCPSKTLLDRFLETPDLKLLHRFLTCCCQDFNYRFALEMHQRIIQEYPPAKEWPIVPTS